MDPQQLIADAALISAFIQLMAPNLSALKMEAAAFVVANPDGQLTLVPWPMDKATLESKYCGKVPAGVVAVVHTHPENCRDPSPQDFKVAAKLGVPVLVLSPHGICAANPSSGSPQWLLKDRHWMIHYRSAKPPQMTATPPQADANASFE